MCNSALLHSVQQQHFWNLTLADACLKITLGEALELFIKQILQIICFVLRAELLIFFNSLKFSLMVPGITCK